MDILESLVRIRREKKMEQKDLAHNLGINRTSLSRYETGKREMPLSIAIEYAKYLGYEIRLLKK